MVMIEIISKEKYKKLCEERQPESYDKYGRVIKISIGLLMGLVIDKVLFYVSKGLSIFLPPFAVMLMNKGRVLKEIRFERNFSSLTNKLLDHFIVK